jgi:hypothetical protein
MVDFSTELTVKMLSIPLSISTKKFFDIIQHIGI